MALFYKWDRLNKKRGEPINLSHAEVASVNQMIITLPTGRQNCSRVVLHNAPEGEYIELDCPQGEVQDRLNDDIASSPLPEDMMEQAPFSAQDQEDEDEEEADTDD